MVNIFLAASLHLGLMNDYNYIHPHVQYESPNKVLVGAFYNSERAISVYMGKKFNGFEIGAATGYSAFPIVPFVRYKWKGIFIAPSYEVSPRRVGIIIGYEIKLN